MNIVVLCGGLSTERNVSFVSGSNVAKALRENGHKVIMLDVFMGYGDSEQALDASVFDRSHDFDIEIPVLDGVDVVGVVGLPGSDGSSGLVILTV